MPTLEQLMIKHGVTPAPKEATLTKAELILRDIICVYHPDIAGKKDVIKFLHKHVNWLNIEGMVEETMAHVGGYDFVDEAHYDFSDGSDCKTASIQPSPTKFGGTSYRCEIMGIGNIGENSNVKSGDLRVVVYNPFKQELEYFFIPNRDMRQLMRYHNSGYRITTTYNSMWDRNIKLDDFRKLSFEELATTPSTC